MNVDPVSSVEFYRTANLFSQHMYEDERSKTIYRYVTTCLKGTPKFEKVTENHLIFWRFKLEERAKMLSFWRQSHVGTSAVKLWAQRMLVVIFGHFPTVEDVIDAGLGHYNEKVSLLTNFSDVFD